MATINLSLIIGSETKLKAEGIIDKEGKIVYTSKTREILESHGRYSLDDVYKQLTELAKTKYPNSYYKIEINIEK